MKLPSSHRAAVSSSPRLMYAITSEIAICACREGGGIDFGIGFVTDVGAGIGASRRTGQVKLMIVLRSQLAILVTDLLSMAQSVPLEHYIN